ncbi:MAG: DUF87 domain-containing protein [Clostridiales bacterium]|nr:DUF87 domain-containing protein [Clostridiales bacterium]
MVRIIPRKTKVKSEFIRGVTGLDVLLALIFIAIAIILFIADFPLHIWIAIGWIIIAISMFFKFTDDTRFYTTLIFLLRYSVQKKKFVKGQEKKGKSSVNEMIAFESIYQDRFINFGLYYAQVIEVQPMFFTLLTEYYQDNVIESFANAIRRLSPEQSCTIVKTSKPMVFDKYIHNENTKYDVLYDMQYDGQITQDEIDTRAPIFEERVSLLEFMNRQEKVYKDHFYLVVYDKDMEVLENTTTGMIGAMASSLNPITARKLEGPELVVFLKSNFGKDFDERDLEVIPMTEYMNWATPDKIKFNIARYFLDDQCYRCYNLIDYPLHVGNAWGASVFLLDRTKVVMKFSPIPKFESEKQIDRAIMEMETKFYKTGRSSTQIELQTHVETLKELLVSLKNNNQQLYNVNTYVVCEDAAKKDVRAMLKQQGFKYSEMFSRQIDGFISSSISKRDSFKNTMRGMPTSTLAATFPFISNALQDPNGIYLGDNEYPVFVDFFKRDRERVNSNMMVIGKSGSGKSYATKTLLTNLAADNCKIFILDPENEYKDSTINLKGKFIDVGSSIHGIINPFHVIASLEGSEDEEDEEEQYDDFGRLIEKKKVEKKADDSFPQHLQFLEQFFRVILEGINADAFEMLNSLINDMYKEFNIDYKTNLARLKPTDYPTFDSLYDLILRRIKTAKDEFSLRNLMTVETYIKKFATGGRNSALWNGPTSIETNENFVTFNFQSLIAGNNPSITNAQMLLVFRYLNNEIINNKDFNKKYRKNRKIIVAVDEAHIFINPKYPIALDFMAQMAKRIRKYGGMLIVITQNISDFVGTEEIRRQSTAVINACQYSMIFSLAPSDINDLVQLYEKSGGINKEEQNSIVTAGVGQAFLITSPTARTTVQIIAQDYVKQLFEGR